MAEETIQIRNIPVLALQIIAFGVVLTALVAGQNFLMPLAIAVLVWSILQAVIERIVHFKIGNISIPRWLATLIGVGLIVVTFLFVIDILAAQADAVAAAWPRYYERLEGLFAKAVEWMGQDVAEEAKDAVNNIDISSQLSGFIGSAGSILINAVLVAIYVGFLIAERGFIPRKLAALVPDDGSAKELHAIVASVGHSVRRYMGVKTIVSIGTALASYTVLKWIGLDFAETWALLIFLLNYIPNDRLDPGGGVSGHSGADPVRHLLAIPGDRGRPHWRPFFDWKRARAPANGKLAQSEFLRGDHVPHVLGRGVGPGGHVLGGAHHRDVDDRLRPCAQHALDSHTALAGWRTRPDQILINHIRRFRRCRHLLP